MARVIIPRTIQIIGHQVDKVQFTAVQSNAHKMQENDSPITWTRKCSVWAERTAYLRANFWDFVAGVDCCLAGADGGGEQQLGLARRHRLLFDAHSELLSSTST